MPFRLWEVVPLMGCSISPSTVQPGLGWPVSVSRETSGVGGVKSEGGVDVSRETLVDVSRETTSGALGWPAHEVAPVAVSTTGTTSSLPVADPPAAVEVAAQAIESITDAAQSAEPVDNMPERATVLRQLGVDPKVVVGLEKTRLLAFANQKGGVGKTTSAVNIASALSLLGYEVLLVDMDPQGNASTALGVEHGSGTLGTYEVLVSGKSLLDVVRSAPGLPGLSVAPATVDLAGAEIELVSEIGRESRLRTALAQYLPEHEYRHRKLDFVVVDCPPSLGLLTINALTAVEEIMIPLQCEYYALEGLGQLLGSIELVKEHLNPSLDVAGILLTMYDGRTRLAPQVADEARAHFPELVFEAVVPRSVRISEAPSYSQTVLTYDPASAGAKAYLNCARELVAQ